MPNDRRRTILVPIYKNKEDIQDCFKFQGIKLMIHNIKLWERVRDSYEVMD